MSDVENKSVKTIKKKRERRNCCVPECTALKTADNHLHQVPKDAEMRQKWALAIKTSKSGKALGNRMQVCSKHFHPHDYIITRGVGKSPKLKRYVVPSLHLPIRSHDVVRTSPMKRRKQERSEGVRKRADCILELKVMSNVENRSVKAIKKKRERHNCCVPECTALKTADNHLHQVPGNAKMRQKWAFAIKTSKSGKALGNRMQVCSKHFHPHDYIITRGVGKSPKLKRYVVPSLHLPIRSHDVVETSPMKHRMLVRSKRARKKACCILGCH